MDASVLPSRREDALDLEGVRAFLRANLEDHLGQEAPLTIVLPAPLGDGHVPLRTLCRGDAWSFEDDGVSITAIATTFAAQPVGRERVSLAQHELSRFHASVARRVHPSIESLEAGPSALRPSRFPLAFVGFSFVPDQADREPWTELGASLVAVPRWTYLRDARRALLVLTTDLRDGWAGRLAALDNDLTAIWSALEAHYPLDRSPSSATLTEVSRERWAQALSSLKRVLDEGRAEKIVAARRTEVTARLDYEPVDVLRRLPQAGLTRFFVRRGRTSFLGATPETLFRKSGAKLVTEALAGTIDAAREHAERELQTSIKDRDEHAPVVRAITDRLRALSADVTVAAAPVIRPSASVLHLRTPIEASLPKSVRALDVLEALHPTPAVAGTPTDEALRWIVENEAPRGWYSGPIGWVDAHDDATFVVALRSGVVVASRAYVFAGGGIVARSEADAEYDEASLKMRPFLRALGARV